MPSELRQTIHGAVFPALAWEQLVLPARLQGRLLFSPASSGPLGTANQVVTIQDTAVFDCPESFHPAYSAWFRFLLPQLARRARQIITGSEFIKGRIVAHAGVAPIRL